jgi:hypothetical protein
MQKLPKQILKEAFYVSKEKNYVLSKILYSSILRLRDWEYCFLGFAYLKCLDNLIDEEMNAESSTSLLTYQKELISKIYSNKLTEKDLRIPEKLGYYFFCYDKENGSLLRPFIQSTIETMEFDIKRRNKILSSSELDRYAIKVGGASIKYLAYFVSKDLKLPQSFIEQASRAYVYADSLIDIKKDLKIGIINIPNEDIERYKINLKILDDRFYQWLDARSKKVLKHFKEALKETNHLNNLSMKILAYLYLFRKRNQLCKFLKQRGSKLRFPVNSSCGIHGRR